MAVVSATSTDVHRPTVRKMLLVDDDEMYLKYWARELTHTPVRVSIASTRAGALHAARREGPDLALVDLFLEPPESGLEVIRALKEIDPNIFCVLVSAHLSVAHALLAVRAGADDVFFKPFSAKQAIARVEQGVLVRPEEGSPTLSQIEWEHIARALHDHAGNITAAAGSLGLHRQSLQRKIQKHAPRVLVGVPLDPRNPPTALAIATDEPAAPPIPQRTRRGEKPPPTEPNPATPAGKRARAKHAKPTRPTRPRVKPPGRAKPTKRRR